MRINSKHKVFIVDDDADDRESIRDAFLENDHEHEYMFMQTGDQLMKHLDTESLDKNYSVILLDLNMPGKDGRDVLKEIKENKKLNTIPVIVLTTSSSKNDREKSYELGANCFVTKPTSFTELIEITDSIAKLWLLANN